MRRTTRTRPHLHRSLLALCAAAAAVAGSASASGTLTFAEALRLSAEAPRVRLAERSLELARRQRAVAAAPVRGDIGAGYGWTFGERDAGAAGTVDLDAAGFDPLTLSLSFPTVGVGPAGDALARAQADVARAEAELAAARRGARLDVTSGFQRAVRARDALELAESDLALAELERAAAELRREAGAASEPELARLALAARRAAAAVAAAEHEVAAADRLLRVTLGVEVGPPAGPLPDPLAWLGDADAAWERRVDVVTAQLQVDETDRLASSTLRDALPSGTLSVGATFGDTDSQFQVGGAIDSRALQPSVNLSYDPDSGLPGLGEGDRSRSFSVRVGLRVPLNPAVGDAIVAARIGRERAAAQLDLTRARAEIEVEQRRIDLDTAAANAELARAGAELALAELELARLRHAGGHLAEIGLRRAELEADRARLEAARADDTTRLAALRLLDALAVDPADLE